MAASQLGVYNKALRWLGERKLVSLSENRESLRYLNDEWSDAIEFVLAAAYWKHAIRNIEAPAETTQSPNFGFEYVFAKPSDWVQTYQVADNEVYEPLLRRYDDINNYWYADISPLYIKYVSNDPDFGLNMSLWTPGFIEYLAIYLASLCAPRLTQAANKIDMIEKKLKSIRTVAIARDAMDLPPGKPPYGTWVQSRAPRGSILPYGSPYPWGEDD